MASASEENPKPSRSDFDNILLESLNEEIAIAFNRKLTPDFKRFLEAYLGLSIDTASNRLDTLFSTLDSAFAFGLSGSVIARSVVKKMYRKAGIPFYEVAGTPMIQYVYDLKRNLATAWLQPVNPLLQ